MNSNGFIAIYKLFAAELCFRLRHCKLLKSKARELEKIFEETLLEINDKSDNKDDCASSNYIQSTIISFISPYKKRCTFSFLSDTTTMYMVSKVLCVENDQVLCRNKIDDDNFVYNVILAHSIFNSKALLKKFKFPFKFRALKQKWTKPSFISKWLSITNETDVCVPPSLRQGLRSFILGARAEKAQTSKTWLQGIKTTLALLNTGTLIPSVVDAVGSKPPDSALERQQLEGQVNKILKSPISPGRKIGPFLAYVVQRFLSLRYYWIDDWYRNDFIGSGALQGILCIAGQRDVKEHKALLKNNAIQRKAKDYFQTLPGLIKAAARGDKNLAVILQVLDDLGFAPLSLCNIEHMLCEYRKVVTKDTGRCGVKLSDDSILDYVKKINSRYSSDALAKLYNRVGHVYIVRQKQRLICHNARI